MLTQNTWFQRQYIFFDYKELDMKPNSSFSIQHESQCMAGIKFDLIYLSIIKI